VIEGSSPRRRVAFYRKEGKKGKPLKDSASGEGQFLRKGQLENGGKQKKEGIRKKLDGRGEVE